MSQETYRNWGDPAEISPLNELRVRGVGKYQRRADVVTEGVFSS